MKQSHKSHETRPPLVVLSGAGLSAESGVATFRGAGGLWEGHRIEEVASPVAFERKPELVHRFYNLRRDALKSVRPNAAHEALVRLEREWPGPFLHVTQNVDDLNERAGARRLLHMHGQLLEIRCVACDSVWTWESDLDIRTECPRCRRAGLLRPNIVWFGEMPMHLDAISEALAEAGIFVCVGTSGVVYPAAGFARTAAESGCRRLIEVNLESTGISSVFTECRHGPATAEVPKLVEELLR
ncbi:MAG: NAD-dependent deacylase [Verrucomicrobiae bacterium]|nr:NAD-dependent deacylase [Verrucomicrobiae bacterium]